MRVLDLFSGIGGFSLGLERAGMRTVGFCEIEPYCRAVLAKRFPGVPILGDIRAVGAEQIAALEPIDVICGGFPCQDISVAGSGAGLAGARSGLWSEYARLIGEIGPRWVIVENVSALLSRGLGEVLSDLAALGYDSEWHCIPASHLGAPHRRDRIWIVAYPTRLQSGRSEQRSVRERIRQSGESIANADADDQGQLQPQGCERKEWRRTGDVRSELADTHDGGLSVCGESEALADSLLKRGDSDRRNSWFIEPDVGRVAHGVPSRVDRLRALGNAVVPQIPEIIGRAIMTYLSDQTSAHHE